MASQAVNAATEKQIAKKYGFALSFFQSDPELWKVFKTAVAQNQPAADFSLAVQKTNWYKTHSQTYRTNLAQSELDPGSWKTTVTQARATIQDQAGQMGVTLDADELENYAEQSSLYGWNSSQLQNALSSLVNVKNATGSASDNLSALKQTAWRNGLTISDTTYQNYLKQIAAGNNTLSAVQQTLRNQGATLAPAFAKEIQGGTDLYDVAQPYIQQMAQTLELDPNTISLQDSTLKNALSQPSADGKSFETQSLPQFSQTLRNDPRWQQTDNAQNTTMSALRGVLSNFGVAF